MLLMQAIPRRPRRPVLIVTAATPMEMRAVFTTHGKQVFTQWSASTLELHRATLILLVSGVGPVNAGIALGHLLGRLDEPLGVVNLGVAGAFEMTRLTLGQTVLVREEIWPEYGLFTAQGIDPQGIGLPLGKIDGVAVWDRLDLDPERNARRMELILPDLPLAVSLTVAGVTGTPERAEVMRSRFAADVENMEGFAMAWACRRLEVPFVQLRTISNLVGSRDPKHWDLSGAKRRLGEVARSILEESYD